MTDHIDLDTLVLGKGGHRSREDGVCIMEAVAWWNKEEHSATPDCASPLLTSMLQVVNDTLPDEQRQALKPLIPKLVGTRGSVELDLKRSYMAFDWLAREALPAWLRVGGLTKEAEALEAAAALTDRTTAKAIEPLIFEARDRAAAAWDAAWDAARAAAWDAARDAAWDAARDAARDAAWAAARDAAKSTKGSYSVKYAAARKAADKALAENEAVQETIRLLERSALQLVERMIEVSE